MAKAVEFKDRKLKKFLLDLTDKTKKIDKRAKEVGGIMSSVVFQDVMKHFKEERGPEGKWDQWSDSYREAIDGPNPPRKPGLILQDTGRLRNSFTPQRFMTTSKGFLWFNPAKTRSGFPYAWAHDNDEEPRTILPRRSFMWLSDKAENRLINQLFKFMGIK